MKLTDDLLSFTNHQDEDGFIELYDINNDFVAYIDKEEAEKIIKHLKEVFEL